LEDNKNNFYVISLIVPIVYGLGLESNFKDLVYQRRISTRGKLSKIKNISIGHLCKKSAGVYPCFVWEFDGLPTKWIISFNSVSDKVIKYISACTWNKEVIEKDMKSESVVIPYAYKESIPHDQEYYNKIIKIIDGKYTFCMTGELQDRKGYDTLLRAFLSEFRNEEVNLLIKCYTKEVFGGTTNDTLVVAKNLLNGVKGQITHYGSKVGNYKCNVVVIPGLIEEEKLSSIYEASDCFVTCTRGEGFGIPLADFLVHYKKPVLSPSMGGHLDFIEPSSLFMDSRYEPYYLKPSPYHSSDLNFVDVSVLSARRQMRKMYEIGNNSDKYKEMCDRMHKYAEQYLNEENNIKMFEKLLEL
jgi:glycosyltransferase involved in cell wall biosynthesis